MFVDAGHRRHPAALSGQPVERAAAARADGSRDDLDHRRSPRMSRAAGPRRCSAPAARSTSSSRSTSAFIAAASIRTAMPLGFVQAVASLPGLRLRGLLSHAGHGYHAASEDELRAIAREEAGDADAVCATRAAASGIALDEISVGATPTLRFSAGQQRRHRAAARQLRLLRSHAGRARRGVARRLRADRARDGRLEAGGRPHHPRLRQQDADERSGARHRDGRRATARCWPANRTRSTTREIDETLAIERLSEEHATVRVTGSDPPRARRSRPRPAQPLVRRVEPGRRGAAGRRRPRSSTRMPVGAPEDVESSSAWLRLRTREDNG